MSILRHEQPPAAAWDSLIRHLPGAHPLQTAAWGAFKQRSTGWQPSFHLWREGETVRAAAMLLTRRIGPLAVQYIPKGPLLDYTDLALLDRVSADLQAISRQAFAIQIKIDPDVVMARGEPGTPEDRADANGAAVMEVLRRRGWRASPEQVQFRNTILIDLRQGEEAILAGMGQGKRRKVRYGPKHGVTVRAGSAADFEMMYALYAETGARNGFLTRPYAYYLEEWGMMLEAGHAHLLIAEVEGRPVAHVVLFHFGGKCLYFIGASTSDNELRKLMPADLLQWEAMRWAAAQGYAIYDLWGAPTRFDDSDPLWGVYGFKRDFGGELVRYIGAWDYTPLPPLYALYHEAMPRLRKMIRRLRRR